MSEAAKYEVVSKEPMGLGLQLEVKFDDETGLDYLIYDLARTFKDMDDCVYPLVEVSVLDSVREPQKFTIRMNEKYGANTTEIDKFCREVNAVGVFKVSAIPLPPLLVGIFSGDDEIGNKAFEIIDTKLVDPFTFRATIEFQQSAFKKDQVAYSLMDSLMHELATGFVQDDRYHELWTGVRIDISEHGRTRSKRTLDVYVSPRSGAYDKYEMDEFSAMVLNGRTIGKLEDRCFDIEVTAMKPIIIGKLSV
jgi:hypothetical protein